MTKFSFQKIDRVIAQTEEMREDLIKCLSLDPEKVSTLYNPLDIKNIEASIQNQTSPFGKNNFINIVASGRLYSPKGFDTLIKAFSIVHKKNEKFRLHILGSDPLGLLPEFQELS